MRNRDPRRERIREEGHSSRKGGGGKEEDVSVWTKGREKRWNRPLGDGLAVDAASSLSIAGLGVSDTGVRSNGEVLVHLLGFDWVCGVWVGSVEGKEGGIEDFRVTKREKITVSLIFLKKLNQ